ncbi:YitT family protein [Dethiobacter alkaliphilus]|uniref:YitT family protein n=1 Tax=Dethiobacter alkaliphilus TaxID=427926 RepID=UPI00222610BB|nr:YitT family protein [Dethiobacter alkaliphilus]MCW3488635.1 YitT family protein [Dethiobacter alkaliphilus]
MSRFHIIREYTGVLLGTAVVAAAFQMFLIPNQIAAGGISGLGVILFHLLGLPMGVTIFLLNLPLFLISAKIFGWKFIVRGLFGAVSLSLLVELLAFLPRVTEDLLLASLYGGILMGVGIALVFGARGSTGGTVLAAQVLNKLFGFTMGQSLLSVDFLVVTLAGIVFNLELAMYALISLFVTSRVIDLVQEGISNSKATLIISSHTEAITERILRDLDRGATILTGKGAYTKEDRDMVLTVVSQSEVPRLKNIVHEVDERAFVIVGNAQDVLGEGFKPGPES